MSSIGVPNSATYAESLSGIEAMMSALPDNTTNEISGKDVRDVVFTLYESIQTANPTQFLYSNPDPLTNPIGNWQSGSFSNVTLQQLFNGIFYKDSGPVAVLSFEITLATTIDFKGKGTQEYIDALTAKNVPNPSAAANSNFDEFVGQFRLKWTATKKTHDLNRTSGSITRSPAPTTQIDGVDGNPLFAVDVQSGGSTDFTAYTKIILNQNTSYSFSFKDIKNNTAPAATVGINYGVRWYWGRVPNREALTSSQIQNLDGAGLGTTTGGSGQFGTTFRRTYTSENGGTPLDPQGNYIAWAWPSSWGTSDPVWIQKAGPSGFATKVQSKFKFKNIYGYEMEYDVWISVASYGSKLAFLQIG